MRAALGARLGTKSVARLQLVHCAHFRTSCCAESVGGLSSLSSTWCSWFREVNSASRVFAWARACYATQAAEERDPEVALGGLVSTH